MKIVFLPALTKCKAVLLLVILSLICLSLSGCGGISEAQPQKGEVIKNITLPKEKPNLIGKVKEIVGNEVTIYKALDGQEKPEPKEDAAEKAPNGDNIPRPSENRPGGGGFEVAFAEETETLMIPVGVPIISLQNGEPKEIEITKITAESTLRIWKDEETITLVQVIGNNKNRATQQEQGNRQGEGIGGPMGGPPPGM
ncbi:hypothetical protein P6N53_09140 [Desulforamulus aquiferis]|uniref:DUF5666 domain-containing protein n=2 Tax=Desulforamulus aquiferis TaxID=1397668 RepID=A0AAW7ZCG8_9FIRM|nr:hypothetical protein [Desulforamulus aquiferis]